jgi:hypothetical protein
MRKEYLSKIKFHIVLDFTLCVLRVLVIWFQTCSCLWFRGVKILAFENEVLKLWAPGTDYRVLVIW